MRPPSSLAGRIYGRQRARVTVDTLRIHPPLQRWKLCRCCCQLDHAPSPVPSRPSHVPLTPHPQHTHRPPATGTSQIGTLARPSLSLPLFHHFSCPFIYLYPSRPFFINTVLTYIPLTDPRLNNNNNNTTMPRSGASTPSHRARPRSRRVQQAHLPGRHLTRRLCARTRRPVWCEEEAQGEDGSMQRERQLELGVARTPTRLHAQYWSHPTGSCRPGQPGGSGEHGGGFWLVWLRCGCGLPTQITPG